MQSKELITLKESEKRGLQEHVSELRKEVARLDKIIKASGVKYVHSLVCVLALGFQKLRTTDMLFHLGLNRTNPHLQHKRKKLPRAHRRIH